MVQSLQFSLFKGGFGVISGTVEWYRRSYGADLGNSETASHVVSGFCLGGMCEQLPLLEYFQT